MHGGTGPWPVLGHRQNFVKALRAARRPPPAYGGCLGFSGGQGQLGVHGIGAVLDGIGRALFCLLAPVPYPQRLGTVKQGRGLCGGIVRILRKLFEPPGGRHRPPEGGSASPEARGGVVPHGIGAIPDRIGPRSALPAHARARSGRAWWNKVAASAGASLEFCESSSSHREAAASLRRVARPLRSQGWRGAPWNQSGA